MVVDPFAPGLNEIWYKPCSCMKSFSSLMANILLECVDRVDYNLECNPYSIEKWLVPSFLRVPKRLARA